MNIQLPSDLQTFVDQEIASGRSGTAEEVIRNALRLLQTTEQQKASGQQPRKSGQWRGRVRMAPDFDDLPNDVAVAFGMNNE